MFKVGDIVECVRDCPYGADIDKGKLGVILEVDGDGNIVFDNYPRKGRNWMGFAEDFILHTVVLENK